MKTPAGAISFVDLKRTHDRIGGEIISAIKQVINKSNFILGEQTELFEKEFAEFIGVKHCVGVNSGTDALTLAIAALGVKPGSEALLPANTFIATSHAVANNGLKPVFVDIDPDDYGMSLDDLERKLSKRKPSLVIAVHLYGQPEKIESILRLARRHKVPVLEDACQAHGAVYKGKKVGTFGVAACFSFYPSKNLGCLGDGGAVVTDSDELAGRLRRIRQFGESSKYYYDSMGTNSRLDPLQAAVLRVKLKYLDEWNRMRQEAAMLYNKELSGIDGVALPRIYKDRKSVYHLYVIRVKSRDKLIERLKKKGVSAQIHYPVPLHLQKCYARFGYKPGSLPVSEKVCSEIISLPMFPYIKKSEIRRVCSLVREFCAQAS